MNLPILYWASEQIGDDRFKRIAMAHADTAIRTHLRPDGSVNHICEHDRETGEFVKSHAGQGIAPDSSWSRGQAWAVYGFVISYIHTGEQRYLDAAIKTADHFIREVKKTDYLPVSDFYAPAKPVYYDASAGMITACGLIEIAKILGGEQGESYLQEAINLLKAADKHFCDYDHDHDPLVQKSTGSYPRLPHLLKTTEVPYIFGDFYFVEAMLKLRGSSFLIW
jgi:unsaturated chondroitin disaccharide hydrolase